MQSLLNPFTAIGFSVAVGLGGVIAIHGTLNGAAAQARLGSQLREGLVTCRALPGAQVVECRSVPAP